MIHAAGGGDPGASQALLQMQVLGAASPSVPPPWVSARGWTGTPPGHTVLIVLRP